MTDTRYFTTFRKLISNQRRKSVSHARSRCVSPFGIESLEARLLLNGDLGGAIPVADIINNPAFGKQQAVPPSAQTVANAAVAPPPAQTSAATPPPVTATILPDQAIGNVYYVSPGGSDSNAGTASAPWHSIQAAVQHLHAGDTAILMDGTYTEGEIQITNSGTASAPITIKAQNKWGAVLNSMSGDHPAISLYASYITIEDLRISVSPNNSNNGVANSADAAIRAWNSNTPSASDSSTGYVGATVRGVLIDASSMRSVGIKTNQDFSLVENCDIHSSLEAFNNTGTIFRNNVIYGGDVWGDSIYGKGGVHNLQIYSNTVHMTNPGGRGLFLGGSSSSGWYDSSAHYEAYDSIAHDNTIINETGSVNAYTLGLKGTFNCTLQNNTVIGGGILFQLPGSQDGYGPNPMPVSSTLANNTFI